MAFFQIPFTSYIRDMVDGYILFFQFMPDDIQDSKSAQYSDFPIVGRSVPLKNYDGSPSRQISLTLDFFTMPLEKQPFPDPYTIKRWCDRLRSWCYPDYSRGGILPPHTVLIRVGITLAMTAVITQCTVSYPFKTWTAGQLLPMGARVNLRFEEIARIPPDTNEVQNGDWTF